MSAHIQNATQARSYIDAYYEAAKSNGYVRRTDARYAVCHDKSALKTKEIAILAFEAFNHSTSIKDVVLLYDALESHVHRLDRSVLKNLEKFHTPGFMQKTVLSLPYTASASLRATMKRIDTMISVDWLQNNVYTEKDLEDLVPLEHWLDKHQNTSRLRCIVVGCNQTLRQIQSAKTLQELVVIARNISTSGRIKGLLLDILKKKMETASSQIDVLKPDQLCCVAESIERLGVKDFAETIDSIRTRVFQRIANESLGTMVEFFDEFYHEFLLGFYVGHCVKMINEKGSFLIAKAMSVKQLWEVGRCILGKGEISSYFQQNFLRLMHGKIKEMILSQNSVEGLQEIYKSLCSIPFYITENITEMQSEQELKSEMPLILQRVQKLNLDQLCQADSLEKLEEVITKCLIPQKLIFPANEIIEVKEARGHIARVCLPEIEKTESLERLNTISQCVRVFSKEFDVHPRMKQLLGSVRNKKNLVYAQEIHSTRTLKRLQDLKASIGGDLDLESVDQFHLQNSVSERRQKVVHGIERKVRHCIRELDEVDKELLAKLPAENMLRIFADNLKAFLQNKEVVVLLGQTAESRVTAALSELEMQMQPDKIWPEYQQVVNKLCRVFKRVKEVI